MTATVAEAIRAAAERLAAVSDTARLDAELLMGHAMRTTRTRLLVELMHADPTASFAGFIERRLRHEPVAYITGTQEFFGREFKVGPAVLIPRADSETVVRAALEARPDARRILDLGTGSGALLLTLLAERPRATGVGVDASGKALDIADENSRLLDRSHRASWVEADWTKRGWSKRLGRFDLIVANPPYVEDSAELAPDVRDHEPHLALFAGPEGLEAYRAIVPQLPALLEDEGVAVLEIGPTQAEAVTAIAAASGFAATLHRDLAGRPRALELKKALGKPPPAHYLEAKPAGG